MGDVRALVEVVARALADDPSLVAVTEGQHRGVSVVEVFMGPGDLGRIIGRQGRTAQAVRTLAATVGEHDGRKVQVEFRDGQPPR
ncbi:MAG: KH domain-containing protein [Luteitalea sp.]